MAGCEWPGSAPDHRVGSALGRLDAFLRGREALLGIPFRDWSKKAACFFRRGCGRAAREVFAQVECRNPLDGAHGGEGNCGVSGKCTSAEELKKIYAGKGVDGSKPVVVYCRIGERSAHSWFVLSEKA